ncbi:MAG: hypothetical protein E7675_01600 [Ruminococcaceae bacterium]|nr:hypothetical protein [Oscillospiraceae bacterium]
MKKIFIGKWIIAILLVAAGIISLWYVYENQYKATVEENEKLRKDIKLYEATITNLDNAKLNEEKYKTETEKIKAEVAEMLSAFPVEIRIEDELLYVEYLEEQLKYDIGSLSIGADYSIYSMANGSTLCTQYVTIPYETTYEGFKNLVTFFNGENKTGEEYPASIVQIGVSYNEGKISGSMVLRRYYVVGQGEYVPPKIPDGMFDIGTGNIFG